MRPIISEQSSLENHLKIAKQHARLCMNYKGCETFASKISLTIEVLQGIKYALGALEAKKKSCYNNTILTYADLDIEVRKAYEKCKAYDQANGSNQVSLIFTKNKNSEKFQSPIFSEAGCAQKIIEKLENLGTEHDLAILVHHLKKAQRKHTYAIKEHKTAINEWEIVIEQEQMAKLELRQQYQNNYKELSSIFERNTINQLFPLPTANLEYTPNNKVVAQF